MTTNMGIKWTLVPLLPILVNNFGYLKVIINIGKSNIGPIPILTTSVNNFYLLISVSQLFSNIGK